MTAVFQYLRPPNDLLCSIQCRCIGNLIAINNLTSYCELNLLSIHNNHPGADNYAANSSQLWAFNHDNPKNTPTTHSTVLNQDKTNTCFITRLKIKIDAQFALEIWSFKLDLHKIITDTSF